MNPSSNSKPCFNGCFPSPLSLVSAESSDTPKPRFSNVALSNQEFAESIYSTLHPHTYFTNHETLPTLQDSYSNFIKAFPKFPNTFKIDEIRSQEYHHLTFSNTCFDYTGNGLFSYAQQQRSLLSTTSLAAASSSSSTFATTEPLSFFDVSYKSVTLPSQILYGGHDTELELRMSERIMRFMNVSESEYTLVFTANEVSAFKILANSFQFHPNGELLTVYDHSSEALETMIQVCKNQAVTPLSAEFSWPSLKMNWRKLKKKIIANKIIKNNNGNNNNKGLFVFPLRSRVTGTPHSYVWMSMAQEKGWRVLLDACSMRPKETSSLGLSMFKPDFMICSFYKVFGENPSGFGCLFVKKSSICSLKDSCNDSALGIVSLVPAFKKQNLSFIAAADVDDEENEPKPKDQCSNSNSVPKLDSFNSGKRFGHMIDTFGSECRGLDHADSVGLMLINCRARYFFLVEWQVPYQLVG
ncbi:Molybdenum cofactor sulfurase [Arachis hypogaea]|nr:Molybdenum cofactor sulfurase [Arachis hypogaea]